MPDMERELDFTCINPACGKEVCLPPSEQAQNDHVAGTCHNACPYCFHSEHQQMKFAQDTVDIITDWVEGAGLSRSERIYAWAFLSRIVPKCGGLMVPIPVGWVCVKCGETNIHPDVPWFDAGPDVDSAYRLIV